LPNERKVELVEEGGADGTSRVLYDRQALARLGMMCASQTAVVQTFVVSREGRLTCPMRCGAIFVANYRGERCSVGDDMAGQLCRAMEEKSVGTMKGLKSVADVVKAVKSGSLPRLVGKKSSLHGEWVEFEDCDARLGEFRPLLWFRFFSRKEANAARRKNKVWQLLNDPPYVCASPVPPSHQASENDVLVSTPSRVSQSPSDDAVSSELTGFESETELSGFLPFDFPGMEGSQPTSRGTTVQPSSQAAHAPGPCTAPSTSNLPGSAEAAGSSTPLQANATAMSTPASQSIQDPNIGYGSHNVTGNTGVSIEGPSAALPLLGSVNGDGNPNPSSVASSPNVSMALWGGPELADSDPEWDVDFDDVEDPFGHMFWNPSAFYTPSATYGRNKLVVNLANPTACNLMCVLLIDSENLMEEYKDEHESPNIDVNYVICKGVEAEIPEGMTLVG